MLDSFVFGFVHSELMLPFQGEEQTREVVSAIFDQLPPGAFPHLVELTKEHVLKPGYTYGGEFTFGLDLVLDGLARARAAEQAEAPKGGARRTSNRGRGDK